MLQAVLVWYISYIGENYLENFYY